MRNQKIDAVGTEVEICCNRRLALEVSSARVKSSTSLITSENHKRLDEQFFLENDTIFEVTLTLLEDFKEDPKKVISTNSRVFEFE